MSRRLVINNAKSDSRKRREQHIEIILQLVREGNSYCRAGNQFRFLKSTAGDRMNKPSRTIDERRQPALTQNEKCRSHTITRICTEWYTIKTQYHAGGGSILVGQLSKARRRVLQCCTHKPKTMRKNSERRSDKYNW